MIVVLVMALAAATVMTPIAIVMVVPATVMTPIVVMVVPATVMTPVVVMAPAMMMVVPKIVEPEKECRAAIAAVTVAIVAVTIVVITVVVVVVVVKLIAIVGVSSPVPRIAAIRAVLFDASAVAVGAVVVARRCGLDRNCCRRNKGAGSECN